MEVAHVLADTSPGWDIHTKPDDHDENNSKTDTTHPTTEDGNYDGYTEHYAQFTNHYVQFMIRNHQAIIIFIEKRIPLNGKSLLLAREWYCWVAYGTGREYIAEEGEVVQGIQSNNNSDEPVQDEEEDIGTTIIIEKWMHNYVEKLQNNSPHTLYQCIHYFRFCTITDWN